MKCFRFRNEAQEVADLFVYGEIGLDFWGEGAGALEMIEELKSLPESTTQVDVHINSPGGDVFEAHAMMVALLNAPQKVMSFVDGMAMSAASYLAMAGEQVSMNENGVMMIHKAWTIALGNADDMRKSGEALDAVDSGIANIYAQKAGGEKSEWLDRMGEETWYDGAGAKEAGLVDATFTSQPVAACGNTKILNGYQHVPENVRELFAASEASGARVSVLRRKLELDGRN